VQAKIFFDRVELYHDRQHLKTYERSYGRGQEVSDWKQYLPTLIRKPGANPILQSNADVVRRIFRMTIEGKGLYEIAQTLQEEKVLSPSYHLAKNDTGQLQHKTFVASAVVEELILESLRDVFEFVKNHEEEFIQLVTASSSAK